MNVIWHKVWSDLWHNKVRSLLAVLSIAVGVLAIGTIFGLVDQLLTGMDGAHRAVAPSHLNIILRDTVDAAAAAALEEIPGVVAIDPVNQLSIRYKLQPDKEWKLATLVMRGDYQNQVYDRLELKEGAWPGGRQIGVERLTSQFFNLGLGDALIVELGGEAQSFTINGLVRHPFVPPPLFGGQPHFFTDATGLELFGIPAGQYGQLLVQVEPYSETLAQEVAGEIRARLSQQGVAVLVSIYQEPDRHWGRMFVEGVTVVMQVMAIVSLFLSVVLVINTMTAMITQQTDQIGVMKAIGGGSGVIIRVYLVGVVGYGVLALLIALPLGLVTAFYASRWFLNIFNIDYDVFRFSWRAVVFQIGAALIAPLLAALWPVWRGAGISVREAIASYGLGHDFGSGRFDRLVDWVGERFLPTLFAAALGNLFRRKGRLTLTLLVLTTAGVTYLMVMSLVSSTNLTLDQDMARRGYDFRIGFGEEVAAAQVLPLAETLPGVTAAELWYSRNVALLRDGERLPDSAGLGAQLLGIPPDTTMRRPLIVSGRWLQPDDAAQVIVINQETARKNGVAVGDTVDLDLGELGVSAWQVVGLYKELYDIGFAVEPVYAPLAAAATATGRTGVGTQVYVQTDEKGMVTVAAASDQLKSRLSEAGIPIDLYTTTIKLEERRDVENQFASVEQMLLGLSLLMACVGGIGLMGSLGISVVERTREIGVLRAIGARSRVIMGMFLLEGVLQGVLSWFAAAPIAYLLAQPMARRLGQTMLEADLSFAFNHTALFTWLLTILILSTLASILPARRATRISVRESLAYG
ncbi:MAG: FtsX-like permease family protein [Anaerolineae bacterium]|nr:FtsX-like permease family protein [Anaerolineae bacterium]